jgi:ABC-type thiamine transport system substrate-binding protein
MTDREFPTWPLAFVIKCIRITICGPDPVGGTRGLKVYLEQRMYQSYGEDLLYQLFAKLHLNTASAVKGWSTVGGGMYSFC